MPTLSPRFDTTDILSLKQSRVALQTYINESTVDNIHDFEAYKQLAGPSGLHVPRALSSLIFHTHTKRNPFAYYEDTTDVLQVSDEKRGLHLTASAIRSDDFMEVHVETRRHYLLQPNEKSYTTLFDDNPMKGVVSQARPYIFHVLDSSDPSFCLDIGEDTLNTPIYSWSGDDPLPSSVTTFRFIQVEAQRNTPTSLSNIMNVSRAVIGQLLAVTTENL